MRIAFINQPWNFCPPPRMGSIATWTYEVARRLAAEHEVVVYARKGKGEARHEERERMLFRRFSIEPDLRLIELLEKSGLSRRFREPLFASSLYYASYILRVAYDLRARGCQIVHVHQFSQFVPILKALNPGVRVVLHMQCEWLVYLPFATIARRLGQTTMVFGCSDHIAAPVSHRFPRYRGLLRTVYNGVEVAPSPLREHPPRGEASLILLFVGRITPEKGLHVLLDAFKRIAPRFPHCKLRIVGPESVTPREFIVDLDAAQDVKALERFYGRGYLEQLRGMVPPNLRESVEFPGPVPHGELGPYYASADVLVNPSLSESFGMALIEAMVHALPVVATQVGGMREVVVDGETGLLVRANDADKLAAAITRLLGNAELRQSMGERGRDRAMRMFSWEAVARDVIGAYQQAIRCS